MSFNLGISLKNWLSLRYWKKRSGSGVVAGLIGNFSEHQLLELVQIGQLSSKLPDSDLRKHVLKLESEFIDKPLLCLIHAILIVLIRREADVRRHFAEFEQLWSLHETQLLAQLNLRWLISAADTLIDHHADPAVRSLLLCSVMSLNLVKVYETARNQCSELLDKHLFDLQGADKFSLFDGVTSFKVGSDDTLANMKRRMLQTSNKLPYQGLFFEVYERLKSPENSTLLYRLAQAHTKSRTQW